MVSHEVGTIKTDIVKMSSNEKRVATWMNNALDEHSELNYNEFKRNPTIGKTLFCQKVSLKRILDMAIRRISPDAVGITYVVV